MAKDDEKNEIKFNETFQFKVLFAAIEVIVVVTGLYYLISPYQNCLRDTKGKRAVVAYMCGERSGW